VINVDFDMTELDGALGKFARATRDLRPVWREIAPTFRKLQAKHIDEQAGPDGKRWPGPANSTIARRLRQGGRAKHWTKRGKLRKRASQQIGKSLSRKLTAGMVREITPMQTSLTSRIPWAWVHQHGGTAGKASRIPARPWLYVDELIKRYLRFVLHKHLSAAWGPR
jgi:phage virion morphogenesis protein